MVDYVYSEPNLKSPHAHGPLTVADMINDFFSASRGAFITDGTFTASTTAAPLTTVSTPCSQVVVQNDPDNTGIDIFVGSSTSQSIQLKPGDSTTQPVNDVSHVYVKAASGSPVVNWQARN